MTPAHFSLDLGYRASTPRPQAPCVSRQFLMWTQFFKEKWFPRFNRRGKLETHTLLTLDGPGPQKEKLGWSSYPIPMINGSDKTLALTTSGPIRLGSGPRNSRACFFLCYGYD